MYVMKPFNQQTYSPTLNRFISHFLRSDLTWAKKKRFYEIKYLISSQQHSGSPFLWLVFLHLHGRLCSVGTMFPTERTCLCACRKRFLFSQCFASVSPIEWTNWAVIVAQWLFVTNCPDLSSLQKQSNKSWYLPLWNHDFMGLFWKLCHLIDAWWLTTSISSTCWFELAGCLNDILEWPTFV